MLVRLPIVVRSTEVDFLGHVNNAVYQQWMEWGRFEWVRACGLDLAGLRDRGLSLVVVHVSIDYRREARLDQQLVIETALSKVGTRSLAYQQRVLHADGTVASTGEVALACFDIEARRSAALPPEVREALRGLLPESGQAA
ncbi:MAG: acyl-CoA thioesterase [Alphaproteobacteria bacterium]|nr:acyl-CoA thioesterase [Alphaproteobacteria bacterium]